MTQRDADVLIVGGGIAGPALAAALAPHGFRVILLERRDGLLDTARGDHLQPKVLEILDSWGALDDVRAKGAEQRDGTIWYDASGRPLLTAMLTELDLPYPYFLYLNHELISAALMDAASRSGGFKLLKPVRGWSVRAQTDTAVVVDVDLPDGSSETVSSHILVGADGQNSRVRQLAGIDAETVGYQRPINIFFGRYTEAPPGNSLEAYIGEQGILALVPRTGGVCKVGVASAPDEVKMWRELSPLGVQSRLGEMAADFPVQEPEYVGVYPPVRVMANRWVGDNVVLLGDACHAMHPAQSQGMNVSIRCADALARALIRSGGASKTALATYERETKPFIDPLLKENHRAGALFDSTDSKQLLQFAEVLRQIGQDPDTTNGTPSTGPATPAPSRRGAVLCVLGNERPSIQVGIRR
ncbi:FAD-dependent monooxygenase [Chloroflexi bacterium TSY]|nr:FAD-dependent monooxygenase [Chloroflexi bacterium TSY]